MSMTRVLAIFEKDLKDFFKNFMLLFLPVVPIFLAVFYKRVFNLEEGPVSLVYLMLGIIFSGLTATCMMIMMAEEKEKKTLDALILSPAGFMEILVGKSLVTTLITGVTYLVTIAILGTGIFSNIQVIFGQILLFLFFLFLGIAAGFFSSSTAGTVAYNMPIMFLFGFTPMYQMIDIENEAIVILLEIMPLSLIIELHDSGAWKLLFYLFLWVIAAFVLCFFGYKKETKGRQIMSGNPCRRLFMNICIMSAKEPGQAHPVLFRRSVCFPFPVRISEKNHGKNGILYIKS